MKRILKIFLIASIFLAIWIFSCEKNSDNKPDDEPVSDTIIQITYSADNSKTVSGNIDAASGGSVTAEDNYGVSFELILPPGSLQNNTVITMTPFKSFSISGAGGTSCENCTSSDEDCCHHGIILGPSGLQLDSSATLIVRFPVNANFPFESSGLIVYIDSASNIYSSFPTQTNQNDRTLTAQISHFSGYGTDETNKERLRREILETYRRLNSEVGTDKFYQDIWELERLHWLDGFTGPNGEQYNDLVALLESLALQIWSKQVPWELARSSGKANCDAIYHLGGADYSLNMYTGWHNGASFASLRTSIRNALSTTLGQALDKGKALCQMDSCQAGTGLLTCARAAYIGSGFEIPSLIEGINQNLGSCCKGQINISANRTSIRVLPLSRTDLSDSYAVITAIVTGADGKPKENIGVWFDAEYPIMPPDGGTTDAEGKLKTVITGYNSGESDEQGYSESTFVAHATLGGEEILSEPLTISFKMPMIELNLNYNLSYSEIPPGTGCYTSVNISINGSGKRLAGSYPTLYTCTADISRSYSYSWQCDNESVTATIHPDFITYYGCPFDIMSVNLEQVLLPEGNYKYVYYIKNLIFYPVTIFIYDINECHNPGECIVNRVDNYSSDVLPVNYINGRHDFENDGSGSFPEYTWSNSITNESTNLKANLSVQMRVIY